jgi:hypothetical protein
MKTNNSIHISLREVGIKSLSQISVKRFLSYLISIDVLFIVIHIINSFTFNNPDFKITSDRSYPEFYQYTKYFLVVLMLINISIKNKSYSYTSWAILFTYFLIDDSFQIHETFGGFIANIITFSPPFGLRRQDIGELVTSSIAGLVIFPTIIWKYLRGTDEFKKETINIALLVSLLVFCGIFLDMLHEALPLNRIFKGIFGILEDGGEMVAMTLITWYIYSLNMHYTKKQ